jgi:hypothetical protein
VLDRLGEGAEITPDVQRHFEECERCHALYGWMYARPLDGPSQETGARIGRLLTSSLEPAKPLGPTAEFPIGRDEGIEQGDFDGKKGPELLEVAFSERIDFGGVFAGG